MADRPWAKVERVQINAAGQVVLKLKTAWPDGTTHSGLARIAAVRDVVGPQRRLMVDCHWRFDERPLFDRLVGSDFGPVVDGHCQFPAEAGLGAHLLDAELLRHAMAPALHCGAAT